MEFSKKIISGLILSSFLGFAPPMGNGQMAARRIGVPVIGGKGISLSHLSTVGNLVKVEKVSTNEKLAVRGHKAFDGQKRKSVSLELSPVALNLAVKPSSMKAVKLQTASVKAYPVPSVSAGASKASLLGMIALSAPVLIESVSNSIPLASPTVLSVAGAIVAAVVTAAIAGWVFKKAWAVLGGIFTAAVAIVGGLVGGYVVYQMLGGAGVSIDGILRTLMSGLLS
ncbi:MAG: hypothetical protein HY400_05390 [Elusimicrobia bacterium]|nr:hypothetical protein [Elusimicrobiota bacterium]